MNILENTECKFNVNSFKLVYVVNSESYLYKRMALKRAKEVGSTNNKPMTAMAVFYNKAVDSAAFKLFSVIHKYCPP